MKTVFINACFVGAGGFVGALLRYGFGGLVQRRFPLTTFPLGTLAVNLLGCLAIGAAAGLVEVRQHLGPEARTFVFIGLLGGFTTFSTFGYETFALLRSSEFLRAFVYMGAHVLIGVGLVWLGFSLTAK